MNSKWENYHDEFLFIPGNIINSNKIFAFDLDQTLITFKDGQDPIKYNNVDPNNWIFLGPIKEKILELSSEYSIFIITNQPKISDSKRQLIENVWEALDRIPYILCAHKDNLYRKPSPKFIDIISMLLFTNGITIDKRNSYFSGDAVGPLDKFPPYQWSSDDYVFAINAGINFIRPIDLFGISSVVPTQDIVIMMGTPGSLKTTFAKNFETQYGYKRLSQDEVGDLKNKISEVRDGLLKGEKFVLDATHASLSNRLPWLNLTNQLNKKVMIAWIIREGRPWNKLRSKPVSHFAYVGKYGYVNNFDDPEIIPPGYNYTLEKIY